MFCIISWIRSASTWVFADYDDYIRWLITGREVVTMLLGPIVRSNSTHSSTTTATSPAQSCRTPICPMWSTSVTPQLTIAKLPLSTISFVTKNLWEKWSTLILITITSTSPHSPGNFMRNSNGCLLSTLFKNLNLSLVIQNSKPKRTITAWGLKTRPQTPIIYLLSKIIQMHNLYFWIWSSLLESFRAKIS